MRVQYGFGCEASPSIAVARVDLCELILFLQHVDLHVDAVSLIRKFWVAAGRRGDRDICGDDAFISNQITVAVDGREHSGVQW